MNLKVGDKLLCKQNNIIFIKNNYYFIIETLVKDNYNYVRMSDCAKNRIGVWYIIEFIWDYFCTPQEIRKLKLEKLMK